MTHLDIQLRNRARGAALVIAMTLLLILTLLAVTGMSMSTAELVMAGNEQFHRRACDAAAAGVEAAIARLAVSAPAATRQLTSEDYIATTRYVGDETSLPQSSSEKVVGRHFEIESTGASARGASDEQVQGVMVITAAGAVATFGQMGGGLQGGAGE